ncbi:hypothetical protein B9Z55_024600 [Caenorhabditis nigoni]|uniref:Anion exchange protein n=1 Tax=Caenorhabditis nigoni TaxID=1611254 RepID=A0A2G5SVG5_9PELO|nr:hypothetical protein B9Z55_024600 [Caenorhabditis nigoni]
MPNSSPGRHSNRAFRLGADDLELETSFGTFPTPDPLGHLLNRDINEHSPLILERIREESEDDTSGPLSLESNTSSNERLPASIDIFSIIDDSEEWKPTARFCRYEWDVEGFDNHLGCAHVPIMPMETYQALQMILGKVIIHRHVEFCGIGGLIYYIEKNVADPDFPNLGETIKCLIESRVAKVEKDEPKRMNRKMNSSSQSLHVDQSISHPPARIPRNLISEPNNLASMDTHPERRLVPSKSGLRFGASFVRPPPLDFTDSDEESDQSPEHSILICGAVEEATVCRLVAIRFEEAIVMRDINPKRKKPTRTLYFLLGPNLPEHSYLDLGRAFATIVSNPVSNAAFETLRYPELLPKAVDRFLAETVVIAPGKILSKNYISGEQVRRVVNMQSEKKERSTSLSVVRPSDVDVDIEKNETKKEPVEVTGSRPYFLGMRQDIRNRLKYFWSDYTDGFNWSMITVVAYMFAVTVVPTLTFGAILELGTQGALSVKSCLFSQAFSGLIWSLFAAQPLLIMSPTGPFLVFEKALSKCAASWDFDYIEVRVYVGMWLFLFTILGTWVNCARFIRYVTVFTEDIFCCLISVIFFTEVEEFLMRQYEENPIVNLEYYTTKAANCTGDPTSCSLPAPNSFLIQTILLVLSIAIFHYLRQVGVSNFFGRKLRNLCNNFGGIFAVVFVSILYHLLFSNVKVAMVQISDTQNTTSYMYGFLVIPKLAPDAFLIGGSFMAAVFLYVLIFVEAEIPEQMALRNKRKLRKGGGLHWDLIVVGFCTLFSSFTGLPWMCPAAVQSLAHITACTEYEKTQRGEPKKIKRVLEQRVSGIATYILLLAFAFYGHFLAIPSAAIFGVFFYLGVRNLEGNQMIQRASLVCYLPKNRGSHKFLDLAPFWVVQSYTVLQIIFVCGMYVVKSKPTLGVLFPLFLVITAFFVAEVLPRVYDEKLLEALDEEDEEIDKNEDEESAEDFYHNVRIPV